MKNYITKSSQNPKVVILSDQPKDRTSGPNIVISNLFPLLEKKIDIKWKVCPGLELYKLKRIPHFLRALLVSLSSFLHLLFDKEIRECQIINGHGISSWLATIWLSKFLKKISLITFHETYEYTKLKWFFGGGKVAQWVWNYTIRNSDNIIDVSNTIKLKKAFYIPNGVDINKFKPKERKEDKKRVLFVGRLSPEKGLEYFIEASKIIKKYLADIEFIVVTGKIKDGKGLKMVHVLKENNIKFYNNIPHEKMPEFYQKASIFVLPSLCEACPLVLLEAISCGIPVVATKVGGVQFIVKDGFVGFLVPSKNPQAIAEKVLKILENARLKKEIEKNCLEWIKNFTWEKTAEEYLRVYQKILEKAQK